MNKSITFVTCDSCGTKIETGLGKHPKIIPRYNLCVCRMCYAGNHDGWANSEWLEAHMEKKGIKFPEKNEQGWYPRD